MTRSAFFAALFQVICFMTGPASAQDPASYRILRFEELKGWESDNHHVALQVFLETCDVLRDPDWETLCALGAGVTDAKGFFERFFSPVLITQNDDGALFTGYFEPELSGSPTRTERYRYPVYKMPPEARKQRPWLTRHQIETTEILQGRGLEIAWVDDSVELFFLQIQGSGRIRYPDGTVIRVGYGGANGHPYRSIGQEMVRRGIYNEHQVSAQVIANWVRRNPAAGRALLRFNDSYVFFREVSEVPPDKGPLGALNRSITPMRSVAVDPKFTPLGAPVWLEKGGVSPISRLMIAQDTGSAIKGAQRADLFIGTGDAAGRVAGKIKDRGRMLVLMPIQRAYALLSPDANS